jgi:hypothetical protein
MLWRFLLFLYSLLCRLPALIEGLVVWAIGEQQVFVEA